MNKQFPLLLLLALIVFLHFANALYFGSRLPNCARSYVEGMNSGQLRFDILVDNTLSYAPLYATNARIIERVVGKKWTLIVLINNAFYFYLLLVFSLLLGKKAADRETGILMAMLVSLYPLISAAFNRYSMDFAITGIIVMSFYFLYASDFLLKPWWSLAACFSCLYGLLVKEPFAAYIAGPLLYTLFCGCRDAFAGNYRRLWRSCLFIVSLVAVTCALYGGQRFLNLFWQRVLAEPTSTPWYDPQHLRLFWIGLWESQLSIPFFLVFIAGIYYFIKNADAKLKLPVLLWILIPNAFVMLMPHWKTERYLLPQLPALALISSYALRRLTARFPAWIVAGLLAGLGIYQIYDLTYKDTGLATLRYGDLYYWNPFEMSLSCRNKTNDMTVAVSRAILNDIEQRQRAGTARKSVYRIMFFPDDWSKESWITQSYFLLNSDSTMEEALKCDTVMQIVYGDPDFAKIDYLVHFTSREYPDDGRRCTADLLLKSYQLHRPSLYRDLDDTKLNRVAGTWDGFMAHCEYRGLVYDNGKEKAFLYRNTHTSVPKDAPIL